MSFAGLAAHSELPGGSVVNGYSGHVSTRATSRGILSFVLLGTRGLLGGLPDVVFGLGSRGQVARSEGGSERGVSKWHVPKEAFGLAFGTSVVLRRFPKDDPMELRRGHPAGLRDGSEGFIGRVLSGIRVILRKAPKG